MTSVILGPPGTGKTTAILNLIEEELNNGTAPDKIGYFAFTKGMIALANKDLKNVHKEAKIASKFLRDKTLNLLFSYSNHAPGFGLKP